MIHAVDEKADVSKLLSDAKGLVEEKPKPQRINYFVVENGEPVPAEPTDESNSKALILQKVEPIMAQIYLEGKLANVDVRELRNLAKTDEATYSVNGKLYPVTQLLASAELSLSN